MGKIFLECLFLLNILNNIYNFLVLEFLSSGNSLKWLKSNIFARDLVFLSLIRLVFF